MLLVVQRTLGRGTIVRKRTGSSRTSSCMSDRGVERSFFGIHGLWRFEALLFTSTAESTVPVDGI
jgi:hypothetical protein